MEHILKIINSKQYTNIFNNQTKNRKYPITLLLESILFILATGISCKNKNFIFIFARAFINCISLFSSTNIPSYTTIYKFYNKLIKYDIINYTFNNLVKKYLNKHKPNKFIIDTTFISNKLGIDFIGYNKQIPKHQLSKLSILTDIKGIPINILLASGNNHDAKIFMDQLNDISNILKPNNKFIADAAYDSNNIRNKLNDLNLGDLVAVKNKRNCKNVNEHILENINNKLLSYRYIIELVNNKLKQ